MDPKSDPQRQTPKMDASALWKEEVFTDRKVGTIRRLSPVRADGSPDALRKPLFVGEAQIVTSVGAIPLNFEIPAATLDEAVSKYSDAVQAAFNEAMEEIQEMRRRASSSLVIPQGGMPPDLGKGGFGPGGLPGGGKLKLP